MATATETTLGSYSQDCVPGSMNERRWALKKAAGRLLPDTATAHCLERLIPGANYVEIFHDPQYNTSSLRNLVPCNRVWLCPVCAQKITDQRRKELSAALAAARQRGLVAVLVTHTLRHSILDALDDLLCNLLGAFRAYKSGRGFQDIKDEWGWIGSIRDLETTYGDSGWHPHIHELVFLDIDPANFNPGGLEKWLKERWGHVLRRRGYDASYEFGLTLKTAQSDIADYIAKWGHEPIDKTWGVEHEIAKSPAKKAHKTGKTPFQLLGAYEQGCKRSGALFSEYARCFEGRNQLVWSRGLKALLQVEIADGADEGVLSPGARLLAYVAREQWARVVRAGLEALLLDLARLGDFELLARGLACFGIDIIDPPALERLFEKESEEMTTILGKEYDDLDDLGFKREAALTRIRRLENRGVLSEDEKRQLCELKRQVKRLKSDIQKMNLPLPGL